VGQSQQRQGADTTDNDFRGRDLRGRSFRDQDLSGADFSGADVRGSDFTDARLAQANFTDARLGVRPLTGALIFVAALAISIAAGLMIGYFADTIRDGAAAPDWRDKMAGWLLVLVVVVFLGFLIFRGVRTALLASVIVLVVVVVVDVTLVYSIAGEIRYVYAFRLIGLLVLAAFATLAGVLGRIIGGTFGAWAIAIVAVIGGLAAGRAHGGLAAIIVSMLLVYLSKRALKLDARDRELRKLAHRLVTRRGTRFTGADISGVDFTGTLAAQADATDATLEGAIWEHGKGPRTFRADH